MFGTLNNTHCVIIVKGTTHCMMQGLVFGVGTDKGVLKLFDVRSYAQGPFDAFTVSHQPLIMLRTIYKAVMHHVVHVQVVKWYCHDIGS